MPGVSREKEIALLKRRKDVAERYLRGETQWEIGLALGVDRSNISRDIAWIEKQWLGSLLRNFDEAKARELARIDELERTYWQAWQDSRRPKEISTSEQRTSDHKKALKAGIKKEQRDGDPRFLEGVRWCIEQRCKILGIIVHKVNVKVDELDRAIDRELARLSGRPETGVPEAPQTDANPGTDGR